MTDDKSRETEERYREDERKESADESRSETTITSSRSQEQQRGKDKPEQTDRITDRDPPDNGDGSGGSSDEEDRSTPPSLSDDELHLLTFLWFLERNDSTFDITGFQAKRLYEHTISDSDDVSELYAALKGQFIRNHRDANPFEVTTEGREQVRQAEDVQTSVSKQLAGFIADTSSDDRVLQRFLWLAATNESDFNWYLQEHADQVDEPLRFLPVVFTEEAIQMQSSIRSVLNHLEDLPDKIYREINSLLEGESYLKGLATVEGEAVTELLQINTDSTMRCSDSNGVLSYYLGEDQADTVIQELKQAGIDVNRNTFGLDLDGLLSQHRDQLEDWLTFDREGCQTAFETYWDLIIEWHRDFRGETNAMKQQLVDVGAAIPQGNQLAVRIEAYDVAGETVHELQTVLQDRLIHVENVSSQIFFDLDEAKKQDEEILVVLHENSWSSNNNSYPAFIGGRDRSDPEDNIFTQKVVLVPSPRELGFDDGHLKQGRYHCHGQPVESPEINREFNAIGEVDGLDSAKNKFSQLGWEQADDYTVRRAVKLLKQRNQISLAEAFDQIADYDNPYQEALYTLAAKRTTKTSRDKNNYTEDILWDNVEEMLQIRYPSVSESEQTEIRDTLKQILVDRAGVELTAFQDEDHVHRRFGDQIDERIEHRIQNLAIEEQRLLATFLVEWDDTDPISESVIHPEFPLYHEFWFGEPPSTKHSLYDVLVSTGICSPATYLTSHKDPGVYQKYAIYKGVRENPDRFLSVMDIEPTSEGIEALHPYEDDIVQLAGIEYLIANDGNVSRDNLRDHLLSIDAQAWMSFDMIDGVIAENDDQIILDTLVLDEVGEWFIEAKRHCITDVDEIKKQLSKASISDLKLDFDPDKGIYNGYVLTTEGDEIQVVIAPWLAEKDDEWIDSSAIVIITSEFYENFFTRHENSYSDLLLIGLFDNEFEVYRSLPHEDIGEPIIQAFKSEYTLLQQDVAVDADNTDSNTGSQKSMAKTSIDTNSQEDKRSEPTAATEEISVPTTSGQGPPQRDEIDLVGELIEQSGAAFPSDVLRDRPLIIVLHETRNDRFGTTVQFLCRELYHQLEGGVPRGRIRGDSDEIERQLRAGNRIEFIDESDGEFFDHVRGPKSSATGKSVQWSKIRRRIQELDTQGLGFLVFQLPTEFASEFKTELETRVRPHRPQIIELKPRLPMDEYSTEESYYSRAISTADALWGYPGLQHQVEGYDPIVEFDTFDDIFTLAERRAWNHLHTGITTPITSETSKKSPVMVVQPHQVGDTGRGNESYLHYGLKVFTVRWLIETEGYTFGSVTTETDTQLANQTNNDVIPDIQVGTTVFEIETLYGSGTPVLALKETIEKYHGRSDISNVQVIVPPIAGFLHYSDLTQLLHEINEAWNLDVSLSVTRLESTEIVSIEQLRQTIEGSID